MLGVVVRVYESKVMKKYIIIVRSLRLIQVEELVLPNSFHIMKEWQNPVQSTQFTTIALVYPHRYTGCL